MNPEFVPIKLVAVITEEVGVPTNDGSRGSALYRVPIRLSAVPPTEWSRFFVNAWDNPSQWTSMHRPGIARVSYDKAILERTTIEEVERYHRDTLILAVDEANRKYVEFMETQAEERRLEHERVTQHKDHVRERAKDIEF